VLHVEQAAEHQVRALSFSPDGTMLLTGSYDKLARVYSTKDWSLLMTS
jgi:WD40 repeat protein